MAPIPLPFSGFTRFFQHIHMPQVMRNLNGISPHDVGLALKRIALKRRPKGIPPLQSDFYDIRDLLSPDEVAMLTTIRHYMEERVAPVIADYWERAAFPHELVPSFAQMIQATWGQRPYAIDSLGPVLSGMACMEMARVDASIYTFFGVQWGLAMGSIGMFGSDAQREAWLPKMGRFEVLGSWSLTEPDVGSATAAGLTTTAHREGDVWVLNGKKKWSGNAPFADVHIIWARDLADQQVKGFIVERGTPGLHVQKLEGKVALRVVQNADVSLENCRVPESQRLQRANSFRDVARQLAFARGGVAWAMTGVAMGAYEHALTYANHRIQFGQPIAGFQLVQHSLVQMLANVTAMQTLCLRMAQLQARDGRISQERASLAKMFCGEKMRETVALARNLLGGNGILLDHHVARFFADAEALYSYEGTHEMNTLIVGRAITGLGAFL